MLSSDYHWRPPLRCSARRLPRRPMPRPRRSSIIPLHGGATDAFWIDWNAGAACLRALNVTCKISIQRRDMAAQKEAFNSALAAHPDGIGTTSAQPGLWTKEVACQGAGIPIVFFNTDDPATAGSLCRRRPQPSRRDLGHNTSSTISM